MSEHPVNPLLSSDPRNWERLVDSLGPASLLVVIEKRMSSDLRAQLAAEDVLQDTLLQLWRNREHLEWRDARSFRALVLTMADNRMHDAADAAAAAKRGGGHKMLSLDAPNSHSSHGSGNGLAPAISTTPSRLAVHREQAEAMKRALDGLPDELREVVQLRAFELMPLDEVAVHLGLGVSAVRHRFRKGAALYAQRLRIALDTSGLPRVSATESGQQSSP